MSLFRYLRHSGLSCPVKCVVWSKQETSCRLCQGIRVRCFIQTDYGAECVSHLVPEAFPRRDVNLTIHVHPVLSCWKREILSPLYFYLHYLNINECSWKPFQRSRNTEVCLPTGNSCNAEAQLIFINLLQTEWRMSRAWKNSFALR
jgi:hypothetical protein